LKLAKGVNEKNNSEKREEKIILIKVRDEEEK